MTVPGDESLRFIPIFITQFDDLLAVLAACAPSSCETSFRCKAARARCCKDFTAPVDLPMMAATSLLVSPSRYFKLMTWRWSGVSYKRPQPNDRWIRPDRICITDTHNFRDDLRDTSGFMNILSDLFNTFIGTIGDVIPIAVIIFGFQVVILRRPVPNLPRVLLGFLFVLLGMAFFLTGLERALFPIGKLMAKQLTAPAFVNPENLEFHWSHYNWVFLFAFMIGASTTIAEPALIAVAIKANKVSGGSISIWGLRIAVALGVAIGISLGTWRIVTGYPIHWFIIGGYIIVIIQTFFAPKMIVPLAYDSGGVTTSTVTVPLVAALGLGLAGTIPGRSPLIDGFGLIAFASLFPIISVMGYAQIAAWNDKRVKAKT